MAYLPLANILHHKLRSALSALGIGIGVCMLLTLAGLSRGSLSEVLDRWEGVDADLIVCPAGTNLTMASGGAIPAGAVERIAELRREDHEDHDEKPLAARVAPVFLVRTVIGGQEHNVFGIAPGNYDIFSGRGGHLVAGRLPDADGRAAAWLAGEVAQAAEADRLLEIDEVEAAAHNVWEMAIDTRLAAMLEKGVGDTFRSLNRTWTITGVYQAGAVSRAFAPLASLQYLCGGFDRVTLVFVKLNQGAEPGAAARIIGRATGRNVVAISEYRAMLLQNVGIMFTYVDAVNAIALVIAFLFIMVTLYTMVLQQQREIAILKSMGASARFLLRQVLAESMLLTAAGAAAGIAMSFGAAGLIERLRPDLSVAITPGWIAVALAAAAAGGLLAGLYPAWRTVRVEVAETLSFE